MRFKNVCEVTKKYFVAPLAVMVICVSLSGLSSGSTKQKRTFQIHSPDLSRLQECGANNTDPCAGEALVLLNALAALDAARQAAQEAYDAWVDCVDAHGGEPTPDPTPAPPDQILKSILSN